MYNDLITVFLFAGTVGILFVLFSVIVGIIERIKK